MVVRLRSPNAVNSDGFMGLNAFEEGVAKLRPNLQDGSRGLDLNKGNILKLKNTFQDS